MTPLAERIMRRCVGDLPELHGGNFWSANRDVALDRLRGAHFFELTEALPLLTEISGLMKSVGMERADAMFDQLTFLPAPKTWIEWRNPGLGLRLALLLCEDDAAERASVEIFFDEMRTLVGSISLLGNDYLRVEGKIYLPQVIVDGWGPKAVDGFLGFSHLSLVAINSPRLIGRRQHMPSGRLEKLLLKQRKAVGSFPLGAWTEIKLAITPPVDEGGEESHEAHLTGQKALHFCRQHLRVRYGRLELVRAHWRGDPALGTKRSRYIVTA